MFTIEDYFKYLDQELHALNVFLSTLNSKFIAPTLKGALTGDIRQLYHLLGSDRKTKAEYKDFKQQLVNRYIIKDNPDDLELEPYSLLASTILKYRECERVYNEKFALDIMKAYNELNPHKKYMEEVYKQISSGSLNRYSIKMFSNKVTFFQYPNSIVKQFYNLPNGVEYPFERELLVNYYLKGQSTENLSAIKSFYINDNLKNEDISYGIMVYEKGQMINPTPTETTHFHPEDAHAVASMLSSLICEDDSPLVIDKKYLILEPIYVQYTEEDMRCVNYPFLGYYPDSNN